MIIKLKKRHQKLVRVQRGRPQAPRRQQTMDSVLTKPVTIKAHVVLDVNSHRLACHKGVLAPPSPRTNDYLKYSRLSEEEWRLCCCGLRDVDSDDDEDGGDDDENVWACSPRRRGDANCRVWAFYFLRKSERVTVRCETHVRLEWMISSNFTRVTSMFTTM